MAPGIHLWAEMSWGLPITRIPDKCIVENEIWSGERLVYWIFIQFSK
jgi:hypothetical protein